jgi:hypothetical protein
MSSWLTTEAEDQRIVISVAGKGVRAGVQIGICEYAVA